MADQAAADRQAEFIQEEVNLARARLDALTANLPARHIPLPPLPPGIPLQPLGIRPPMTALGAPLQPLGMGVPLQPLGMGTPLQPLGMRPPMVAAAKRIRYFAPLAHRMPPPAAAGAAAWTEHQQQQQRPIPVGSAPPQLYPQNGPPPGYPAAGDQFRQPTPPQPRKNRFTYVAPGAQGNVGSYLQPPPAAYHQGQPFPQATGPGYLPTTAPGYNTQGFTHHPAMMYGMADMWQQQGGGIRKAVRLPALPLQQQTPEMENACWQVNSNIPELPADRVAGFYAVAQSGEILTIRTLRDGEEWMTLNPRHGKQRWSVLNSMIAVLEGSHRSDDAGAVRGPGPANPILGLHS
jgi:hypothetical protein